MLYDTLEGWNGHPQKSLCVCGYVCIYECGHGNIVLVYVYLCVGVYV